MSEVTAPSRYLFASSEVDGDIEISVLDYIPGSIVRLMVSNAVWFITTRIGSPKTAMKTALQQAAEMARAEHCNAVLNFRPQLIINPDGRYSVSVTMALAKTTVDLG